MCNIIEFVWSQYDGGNIEQRTIGYGFRQNKEAKLKIVGGVIPWSYQQEADPTSSYSWTSQYGRISELSHRGWMLSLKITKLLLLPLSHHGWISRELMATKTISLL